MVRPSKEIRDTFDEEKQKLLKKKSEKILQTITITVDEDELNLIIGALNKP